MAHSFIQVEDENGAFSTKYRPMDALAQLSPAYFALVRQKRIWSEGDLDVLGRILAMEPANVEKEFLALAPRSSEVIEMPGGWSVPESETISHEFEVGRPEGKGWDALPLYKGLDALPVWLHEDELGLHVCTFSPNCGGEQEEGDEAYHLLVGPLSTTRVGNGTVITRGTTSRFCGQMVTIPGLSDHAEVLGVTPLWEKSLGFKAYPQETEPEVLRLDFLAKASLVAAQAAVAYGGVNLRAAASAVRKFISELPLCTGDEAAQFLSEFVVIDLIERKVTSVKDKGRKKSIDWAVMGKRHIWRYLEARGFEPRATSHATRGREMAIVHEDGSNALQQFEFSQAANKNRISKMFSNMRSFLPIGNSRLGRKDRTKVCAFFMSSDVWGDKPSGDMLRTLDGNLALTTSEPVLVDATPEEYAEFIQENPELEEFCKTVPIRMGDVVILNHYIVDLYSVANSGFYKVNVRNVPGISQPLTETNIEGILPSRAVIGFRSDLPADHLLEGGVEGLDRTMAVELYLSEEEFAKKEAWDVVMEVGNSQLDAPIDTTGWTLEQVVARERAIKSLRYFAGKKDLKKGKAVSYPTDLPVVGEFMDAVGLIEAGLVDEGKDPSGHMFLYRLNEDNTITPALDEVGQHIHGLGGMVTAMRPRYVAEDSYASFKDHVCLSVHDRAARGTRFGFTEADDIALAIARHNVAMVPKG